MNKFDTTYKQLINEMMAGDVLGSNSNEPYNVSDVRTPKVFGTFSRKGKKKRLNNVKK